MAGNAAVIKYLLSVGAAVDPVNDFGESALALAAAAGHPRSVQILLKAGAPVGVRPHGVSLLEYAERFGSHGKSEGGVDLLRDAGAV